MHLPHVHDDSATSSQTEHNIRGHAPNRMKILENLPFPILSHAYSHVSVTNLANKLPFHSPEKQYKKQNGEVLGSFWVYWRRRKEENAGAEEERYWGGAFR